MLDEQIVALYWSRSEQAIAETGEKYGGYLNRIAYGILRSTLDAQECVNDTYHSAWNAMPPNKPNRLSAFLGKITRRLSIDRLRHDTAEKRGGGELPLALDELVRFRRRYGRKRGFAAGAFIASGCVFIFAFRHGAARVPAAVLVSGLDRGNCRTLRLFAEQDRLDAPPHARKAARGVTEGGLLNESRSAS